MRTNLFAILASIITLITVWVGSSLGAFYLLDGIVYDLIVRFTPPHQSTASPLLLVELDQTVQSESGDYWLKVLQELERNQPRQVVFHHFPHDASRPFFLHAANMGNVIFGRQVEHDEESTGEMHIVESIPEAALDVTLPFGGVSLPPSEYGISRRHWAWYRYSEGRLPSLVLLAVNAQMERAPVVENPYYVNFFYRTESLPKVKASRILDGSLVPSMFEGRTILIGHGLGEDRLGLTTPMEPSSASISAFEYEGWALKTLLDGMAIIRPGPWTTLGLLFSVLVIVLICYQYLPLPVSLVFCIASSVILFFITWGLLFFMKFWLPYVELVSIIWLLLVILFLQRIMLKNEIDRSILFSQSFQLKERLLPRSFYNSDEYWSQVVTMVNQTLMLRRTIFLEALENDHRVREVIALNCSIDDIQERRRDYERTPYVTALEEGAPLKVENYLKTGEEEEEQYMVPLRVGNQIMGFWAFGIRNDDLSHIHNFFPVVRSFSNEIAEMLYRRRLYILEKRQRQNPLRRFLLFELGTESSLSLRTAIQRIDRRLNLLEALGNSLSIGTILYDSFGRVIQTNTYLTELFKQLEITPFNMTALDLLIKLADIEAHEARSILNSTVVERKRHTLHASNIRLLERKYVLVVTPVLHDEGWSDSIEEEEASPFELYGILFQLVNVGGLMGGGQKKERLFSWLTDFFHEEMARLGTSCELPEEFQDNETLQNQAYDRIEDVLGKIKTAQRLFESDDEILDKGLFPLELGHYLEMALEQIQGRAKRKNVELTLQKPATSQFVMAEHETLKNIITSLLLFMVQDAFEGSTVDITLSRENTILEAVFSYEGTGMPQDILEALLSGDSKNLANELDVLRRSVPTLKGWGASLEGSGEFGVGLRFSLRIKAFL